jgi:hypothetical protein
MTIAENLTGSPGDLSASIATDTPSDPTLTFDKNVTNATGSAWTGYILNMYMDQPFTITAGTSPIGWLATATTYPTAVYLDSHGNSFTNLGTVVFANSTGSNVAPTNSATFGALVDFSGDTLYTFELEQIPVVPEPATLALLVLGGLFIRRSRK